MNKVFLIGNLTKDPDKPKEDFQVQHIGVSDNDSFEEIVCEVVNWF